MNKPFAPVPFTTHPALGGPGIRHGFFGRKGGVSSGIYSTLNCGVGSDDVRENVLHNRRLLTRTLVNSDVPLITPYQIHSSRCVAVTGPWPAETPEKCDAVVTATPGIVLAVGSADCGPVLFADAEGGVIGAAHAGWKGALGGVLESTIAQMEGLGARRNRITAVLGPAISRVSYEVGAEFKETFLNHDPSNAACFTEGAREGHFQFDLPSYIVNRLRGCGLANAEWTGQCTYLEETAFFSYRRTTHRKEPDYGRQLAAISIT
uniref:peptidoglycan editing factor PgeF n=1 Tax=Pararhizobium sp. IMCC3301 TaxID=3067904 RepID=UPI0027415065|nr:peptidoglycan editing factor PgeF [Pararhizobium sp. IMCC3301]